MESVMVVTLILYLASNSMAEESSCLLVAKRCWVLKTSLKFWSLLRVELHIALS